MGIKGFNSIVGEFSENHETLDFLKNKVVAVDASIFLHAYVAPGSSKRKNHHVYGFFIMCYELISALATPVIVFDGKPPVEKSNTTKARKEQRQNNQEKLDQLIADNADQKEIDKLAKRIINITPQMIQEVKKMLDYIGVSYFVASGEADALCARLCQDGIADAVITEDMDMLCHGVPSVIRNYNKKYNGGLNVYDLDKIVDGLEITKEQLVDVGVLAGCDYADPGAKSAKVALEKIMSCGSLDKVSPAPKNITELLRAKELFNSMKEEEVIDISSRSSVSNRYRDNVSLRDEIVRWLQPVRDMLVMSM